MSRISRASSRNKSKGLSNALWLVIGGALGTVTSVLLMLLIALIIKSMHPDDGTVSVLSSIVKIVSCFACVWLTLPRISIQPILAGSVSSLIYMIISTLLFSVLSKDPIELHVFAVDILISLVCGVLFSLILYKKSTFVKNK